jgi:hypothetical protein
MKKNTQVKSNFQHSARHNETLNLTLRRYRGSRGLAVILLGFIELLAGCSVTTKLTSPLPVNISAAKSDEAIGLYIPNASKQYVWKGNINVATYNVEFGNALEANTKHALSKVFRDVSVIDHFPPPLTSGGRAISVEIEDATVSPGALTFMSTSADVRLKAIIAEGGKAVGNPISVQVRQRLLQVRWAPILFLA